MSSDSVAADVAPAGPTRERLVWLASVAFCGILPVVVLLAVASELRADTLAFDLRQFYDAAHAVLDGNSPYPPDGDLSKVVHSIYPYPPLPALLAIPLTPLPFWVAGVLVTLTLLVVALGVLWTLGVRDWRCYGVMLMWPPVISAIQTGNVTLWLALACAIAWRFRDRAALTSVSLGLALAVKYFLWPVVVWLAVTRRIRTAAATAAIGAFALVGSWAVIGFAGLADYPHLLRQLDDLVGENSYTLYIVGLDLGLPSALARALWLGVGLGLLVAVVVLGRRGDERTAFVLAVAASLALTPIVWLHYFALLIVPVAIARPRLGVVWFVPLALVVIPGSGYPSPLETAWALSVAGATLALAVWEDVARSREDHEVRRPAPVVA